MIIVRLVGGLGNQMFEYALGRCLALKNGVALKLDISSYRRDRLRTYRLGHFNIIEEFARPEEIEALVRMDPGGGRFARLGAKINRVYNRVFNHAYVVDRQRGFDPSVLRRRGDVYLNGYWQSEKYFKDVEGVIRQELTVKTASGPQSQELAAAISSAESVSLHVRRGDNVSNPDLYKYIGICSIDYYRAAVDLMKERLKEPRLFVFSDDHEWVRDCFRPGLPFTLVTHNGEERDYEDFGLMTLCKHHIIANSSFSWWAAWLCENPSKVVVAPRRYFATSKYTDKDLIPDEWIRL